MGGYSPEGVTAWLVVFGFIISFTAYAVINQYEAIRFLGARSEWDFKMGAVLASTVTAICLWFNVTMGPLARADFPGLELVDQAYPLMVSKYLPVGLVGLVVAGLVAAAYSTFASIGMGISSLFVRDVYARFLVRRASDHHYTRVGKICVPLIVALGFLYLPFLGGGMVALYMRLVGAISVPLMTVILMGIFTRVHRATGTVGLSVGLTYGISALLADLHDWPLPSWYTNTWWAYLWNVLLPASTMWLASAWITWRGGPAAAEELEGLVFQLGTPSPLLRERMAGRLQALAGTWLQKTLLQEPAKPGYPFEVPAGGQSWFQRPGFWAVLYILVTASLLFVLLW